MNVSVPALGKYGSLLVLIEGSNIYDKIYYPKEECVCMCGSTIIDNISCVRVGELSMMRPCMRC